MKNKKLLFGISFGFFIPAMSFFYFNTNTGTISDLALDNIEAIASEEGSGTSSCYSWIVEHLGGRVVYCSGCEDMENYIAGYPESQPDGECTRS